MYSGRHHPVPVTPSANDELRNKVLKIWNTCHRPYLISDRKSFSSFETFLSEKKIDSAPLHDIKDHTLLIENLTYSSSEASIYCPKPTDIAFIQFSSGSTGDPKGVVLTHENLVTNIQAIEKGMNMQENDATLSWMPLTHDMGLIGFHILPVLANKQQYLMPTSLFVRRPNLWLSKVQQHQATLTSSPNFGYQHFLQHFKPENASNWDLSHLRLIFNGAEPISASLCHEFLDEMEKYGLNRGVMFTVYGMAEASLAVTFPPPGQEFSTVYLQRDHLNTGQEIIEVPEKDDRTVTFVDVGYPVNDCLIRICDENQQEVEEKIIGNIQIKGKNVTSGYYNNVAASQKAITADGWLDTGDLGFLKEGRLVITGRSKDIIFVNGQNYYAHDLERVAATVPGIDPSKIVACGVSERDTQKEVVVLFVMFRKEISKYLELYEMIKKTMLYKIGIMVHEVIPIKSIPKTTSGKVQRYKLAEQYACDEFAETIAELHKQLEIQAETKVVERPETDIEIKLVQICREILGVNEIGVQDGFLDLGGHSLKMMELISRVHEELSVELTVKDIFDSLTIKELAKKIEHAEESGASAILPVEEQEIYPVSSAQKRIYLLTQLEESERSYHIPIILSVEGRVDYKRLEESFTKLIHRHEILRTSFDSLDGKPISKVHDSIQFKLTYLKGKTNVEEIMNQFIQPFDLRQAPLFRVGIIQVAEAKHFLVLDMHHIISDGTSMNLFIQEFASLYKGEEVPAIQLQYKDFVNWQNDRLLTPEMNKQKEYWLQNLSGELPVLAMPTDFSRPVTQSFEGNSLVFRLDRTSTEKLYQLATNTGTTLYMVLLAAYNIVLSKYTGQEDLIVGSPIAGRTHNSLHHMIGMFVNSLAMRNFPQSTKSVRQFIHEVKGTAISAYANQDYPFDELLDHLYLRRDVSRNPVFDTMFVLQNMEITEPEVEELTFALQDFQDNVSRFDFSLFSQEITDGIHFTLEYATKLFKEETMLRFFQHYLKVLEQIVEEPDQKLSEIELLSELEREELLYTFNHTKHDYPSDLSLAERFAEQVAHTPEQIAIVFEDRKLTYQEVNEKANLVAKHLQLHGVRPNHPVGIMADRNPETIIGILGIIKAGGAYLPLSPDYPVDRMKYMLEDAGVSLLLTQEQREEFLAFEGESLNLQELLYSSESGEEGEATAKKTSGILEPIASTAEDLAYVIYTSGSTGQPKGVMATQRGVMRLVCNPDYVELKEGDSLLQTGALVFDASTFEIWGALLNGLTLVLVQDEVILDVELLEAAIKRHGVSTMWLTS
uniref:condensation domain-containing protein n=1 Tax=Caldalkalibacillus mannanilyticus TaxID=1418 RepID=UPI0011DE3CD9